VSFPAPDLLQEAAQLRRRGALIQAKAMYAQVLTRDPGNTEALYWLAQISCQQGQLGEGVELLRRALSADPRHARAHNLLGMALARLGRREEAMTSYDQAIACRGDLADAHGNRGDLLAELGRLEEAVASYDQAVKLAPSVPNHCNRAAALCELGRFEEAVSDYDAALRLEPALLDVRLSRANALANLARFEEAIACFDLVLAAQPRHVAALKAKASAQLTLGRHADALLTFDQALAFLPADVAAHMGRGAALIELARHKEAIGSFDRALALGPGNPDCLNSRAFALRALNRHQNALASCARALSFDPRHVEALNNRAAILCDLERYDEALASYDQALAVEGRHFNALIGRAITLKRLNRHEEALAAYDTAILIRSDHPDCLGWIDSAAGICDWRRTADLEGNLAAKIRDGWDVSPFTVLGHCDDPALLLRCAQNSVARQASAPPSWPRFDPGQRGGGKIRIAYLSADFRAHVMGYQIAELIERHDRDRFEVLGVSFAVDDGSAIRARLIRGFDRFLDVRARSDREVAQALRALEVDIAIDLMGHTRDARLGILAQRAAPIQVSYLGYAGTSGADFIDYILGDPVVLPFAHQPFYRERIVQLPDSFFATDSQRPVAASSGGGSGGGRREAGLPEQGFVFCCFNNAAKLNPAMFDIWMRLLAGVPDSVLWLSPKNASAERNLREEARRRGIDAGRLVFAPRVAQIADHLARHRLADLFLDTLPYNAHATAGDALWAGLPVLTCLGASFAARVGGSLVRAVGLPELVTASLAEYEALALRLARERGLLACLRERLERNRAASALFDTARLARHIEAAYATMWETWQRGEAPRAFRVEADGASER
jgi:protein O-GlcNAc transferase